MQGKVPDQGGSQRRIAEAHVFQLHLAGELGVVRRVGEGRIGEAGIVGIFHHVVHPLHLGAHLLDGLARGDEQHGRSHEGAQKALEAQDGADGKAALHHLAHAQDQHRRARQGAQQGRDHAQVLVELGKADRRGVHRGLIARPFFKVAVFRAAGLDGLHHLDAGDGGGGKLAAVPHLGAGDVHALGGDDLGHQQIQHDGGEAHNREQHAVAQHDHQIKDHHPRVQQQRGKGIHQGAGDGGVGVHALQDIARHALGKEAHGHFQQFPQEGGAAHQGHFAVDLQGVDRLDPGREQLGRPQKGQQAQEGRQQLPVLPGEQPVHKEVGKHRVHDAEEGADGGGEHDEGHRGLRAHQSFAGEGQGALASAAGLKVRPRLDLQADAGEAAVKFLRADLHLAPGGVVEQHLLAPEAPQHHKVVEVPVDDAGDVQLLPQGLRLAAVARCLHAVAPGGKQYVSGVGPVPGHAAVQAHLLQGDPFAVIGQDHGKAGGAAFQRLHLHDHRHLGHPLAEGLFHAILLHGPPPQRNSSFSTWVCL